MHHLPLLALPGLSYKLPPELQDQAEDTVDDVHYWSSLLRQQSPKMEQEVRRLKLSKYQKGTESVA